MEIISDDLILSLEYYHDNPEYKKFFKKENNFFDIINNKKIELTKFDDEPEKILKEKLFENIKYQNITLTNKRFKNEIIIERDCNYLLIFDNMQLHSANIKLISEIFFSSNYKIFVPSIYIFENLFGKSKIKKIIFNINKLEDGIIISNPFDDFNNIKEEKKQMARNIGIYKNIDKYEILNFNNICVEKNKINLNSIIKELENTKKYIEYYNNEDNIEFYNMFLHDAYLEIQQNIIENKINPNLTIQQFYEMTNTIKLILGTKETRDSYYIKEIIEFINTNKELNYKPIYITKDEISNIRCVLNKISSINIYPSIPRYFCYIKDDKLIVKLFSIFFDFLGKGEYGKNKYSENFKIINKESKALITKILTGGYINLNNISLNKTLDFIKYINLKQSSNIENFESIENVKNYLITISDKKLYFANAIFNNPNLIKDYINSNDQLFLIIEEFKQIINNLLLIETQFSYQEIYLLNDIYEIKKSFTYHLETLNNDLNEYIYYSDEIPLLTNCIIASTYLSDIIGYKNFVNDEIRNFIKNILLKEFYQNHSILIFQIIFDLWNVIYDYKNFNNSIIKLNNDGSFSDLPDYDERFPDGED
jgi:hypothetical protein